MDFVERWFGIAPDGGDGSFERLILLASLAIIALLVFRRKLRAALSKAIGREVRTR